jgi:hypothetical protein
MILILENAIIEHIEYLKFLITVENLEPTECEIAYENNDMYFWKRGTEGEKYAFFAEIKINDEENKKFEQFKRDCMAPTNKIGGKRKGAGRPKIANKKVTQSIRLPIDVKAWLDAQEDSTGIIIERAIRNLMNEQLDMFESEIKK